LHNWQQVSMARQHSDFRIDHGRVRYLHETVRHGSMRSASEALGVAPSSVSRQITLLERELDVAVLESGPRTLHLTEAGRAVHAADHWPSPAQGDRGAGLNGGEVSACAQTRCAEPAP